MAFLFTLIRLWRELPLRLAGGRSNARTIAQRDDPGRVRFHLRAILALLVLTIGFGAYIKHRYDGLACGWLTCGGSWLPATGAQLVQTMHRGLAAVTAVYILILTAYGAAKWGPAIRKRLLSASAFVLVQAALGVAAIVSNLALSWAVLHLATGIALFAVVSEAVVYLSRVGRRE